MTEDAKNRESTVRREEILESNINWFSVLPSSSTLGIAYALYLPRTFTQKFSLKSLLFVF